jgi:hypothetical protein
LLVDYPALILLERPSIDCSLNIRNSLCSASSYKPILPLEVKHVQRKIETLSPYNVLNSY